MSAPVALNLVSGPAVHPLTPPTYFISPGELSEFQNGLIDAFGPGPPMD